MLLNSGGSDYTQIISWSVSRVFRLWKGNDKFFLLFAFRNKYCMVLTWSPVCSCIEVGHLKRRYWLPYPMSVKVAGYWPSSLLLFLLCLYGPNDLCTCLFSSTEKEASCRQKWRRLHARASTLAKFYCGNKTGNPERPVPLQLALSGSQSQRVVWLILPARGGCHIVNSDNVKALNVACIAGVFYPTYFQYMAMLFSSGERSCWKQHDCPAEIRLHRSLLQIPFDVCCGSTNSSKRSFSRFFDVLVVMVTRLLRGGILLERFILSWRCCNGHMYSLTF